MCNKYITPDRAEMERYFHLRPTDASWPSDEIFPYRQAPYIRSVPASDIAELIVGQWGMIAPFAREAVNKKYPSNNARTESIDTKPTFRNAWIASQRCLIPAITFDEPNWESGKNQWWRFRRKDGRPWALAGLWSVWKEHPTGRLVPNYTMLTVNADTHPLMSRMHKPDKTLSADAQDKRSVISIEQEDFKTWLHGSIDEAASLFRPPSIDVIDGSAV